MTSRVAKLLRKQHDLDSAFGRHGSHAAAPLEAVASRAEDNGYVPPELLPTEVHASGLDQDSQKLVNIQSLFVLAIMVIVLFVQLVQVWGDIRQAIEDGDVEMVERMLSIHPDLILETDEYRRTLLHLAVEMQTPAVLRVLLNFLESDHQLSDQRYARLIKERQINATDRQGLTPLHLAVHTADVELAAMLIRRGASPRVQDDHGRTPLYMAVERGDAGMVKRLLEKDPAAAETADTVADMPGQQGASPLHVAAEAGRLDIVRMLHEAGADLHVRNRLTQTPLDVAYIGLKDDVADYLREQMSR